MKIMEKNIFHSIVMHPTVYDRATKPEILSTKMKFPYCAILQLADLLSDKVCGVYGWDSIGRSRTLLYMPMGASLDYMLSEVSESKPNENFDIIDEINSYQDISFKTAPKSVILSKFLENEVCSAVESDTEIVAPVEEIAKKSNLLDDDLNTETMAVIFEKQQKFDKAIAVYEKLIVKYPEKSSIFASRIANLKNILETNKK